MFRATLTALILATVLPLSAYAGAADEVAAREQAFYRSFIEADVDAMADIFSDDFVYQHGSGMDFNEAQFLDLIGSGTAVVTRADTPDLRIRDFGDTVVTHGSGVVEGRIEDQTFEGTLRFVNVWHNDDGVWRLHHRNSQFVE